MIKKSPRVVLFALISALLFVRLFAGADSVTTQPTESSELARLQQENANLKSQILALRVENKALTQKLASATTKPAGAASQASDVPTRKQRIAKLEATMAKSGLPQESQKKWLADSIKMTDVIEKYIKDHDRPKDIQIALYDLKPILGMSEADVDAILLAIMASRNEGVGNIVLYKKVTEESVGRRTIQYELTGYFPTILLTFEKDVATHIAR